MLRFMTPCSFISMFQKNTYSFYTLEEYLNHTQIMYCITKFLIILVLGTLYESSLIVHYELILFHCVNLMSYLRIVFIELLPVPVAARSKA